MEAKSFNEVWPTIVLFDLLRYLIPASLAFLIFWVIARRGLMHRFIQRTFPKPSQLWREFGYSMSTVLIFSLVGFGIYSAKHAGITKIYSRIGDYGVFYFLLSFVIMVVFHDLYFYWTHRLMHHKKLFKYIHRVHHESTNPSPWAAYSFHPWEAIIQAMVLPILVLCIPLHSLIIFLFLVYMIVRNVVGHLGFEILPKGFTRNKWVNWNTAIIHHNMHHEHFHSNYGLYFTWWDRWMKTENKDYHRAFDEVTSRPTMCELKVKKTKPVTTCLILLLTSTALLGQSVEGRWTTFSEQTGSALSVIEIVKVGNSIEGKVAQILLEPYQGQDPICSRCAGNRKDIKVKGMEFLWGFRQNVHFWESGKILDPETGEIYESKLWMSDQNTLQVRGYGGPLGLFYRTQTWKRSGQSSGNTPVGVWLTIDDHWNKVKSEVEIRNVEGELKGSIRKIFLLPHEGDDPVCAECDGDLKNSKIVGMKIIWDFRIEGGKWTDGKILDPGNGNVYQSSIWLLDSDSLKVRGYLGPFYRSQVWKRVKT